MKQLYLSILLLLIYGFGNANNLALPPAATISGTTTVCQNRQVLQLPLQVLVEQLLILLNTKLMAELIYSFLQLEQTAPLLCRFQQLMQVHSHIVWLALRMMQPHQSPKALQAHRL